MIKIAFITPEYPHSNFKGNIAGIGTFTKNLAEQLTKNNCQVTVFIHSQNATQVVHENNVEIHFVKKKAIKGMTWYANRHFFNNYVNNIIKQKEIQVIEAPEWTGFTAFMQFYCPLVIRLHGSDTYFCNLEGRKVKAKNKFFEKKALLGAHKIIGVSKFVAHKTKELFQLQRNIEVVYNSINTDIFTPNHQYIKPKSLLYFGTITRKKGVLEIAKVFNKVVEKDDAVTLTLLGRDTIDVETKKSTLEIFQEILSKKALKNFTYIKSVSYDEVVQYIQQSEIIVLPSFAEAFPMAWLEAMALEKKIITSNIGWAKELMIDGETGYTVNPTNINKFTSSIFSLLGDDKNGQIMAKKARQRIINEFDMKDSVQQNIKLYKQLANNK